LGENLQRSAAPARRAPRVSHPEGAGEREAVVIGGAQIYAAALPFATDLRLTEIALNPAGDTHFPEFARNVWREISREAHVSAKGVAYDLVHYQRQA